MKHSLLPTFFRPPGRLRLALSTLVLGLCALPSLIAQSTFYWGGGQGANTTGPVSGGSGEWGPFRENWSTTANGSTYQEWDVNPPADAVFSNNAGTVKLITPMGYGGMPVRSLTFEVSGYTIVSVDSDTYRGVLFFGDGIGSINTGSGDQTISVKISGVDGLTKTGSGTLTLTETNNYSGGTTINEGTLRIGADGGTSGSLGSGDVINHGTLQFNRGNNLTVANRISGTGSLIKDGLGALELTNSNTYSGGTFVNSGYLNLGHATDTLPDTGPITISGGILSLGANSDTVGAVTLSSGSITGSGTLTASSYLFTNTSVHTSANLGGAATLTKTGNGTVTLSGNNTYTGGTIVNDGTLSVSADANLGASSGILTLDGGTLRPTVNFTSNRAITLGPSGGALSVPDVNTLTWNGPISGSGGLTKSGDGTLILSGNNSYTGGTTLARGILALGSTGALGPTGIISFDGGTLRFSSDNTTDYSSRFSTNAGQDISIDTNSRSVTFASDLTSSGGSLTKSGSGTLTLTGNNTYDGGTTLNQGTLVLGHATDTLADTGAVTLTGGILSLGSNSDTVGAVTLSAGRITGSGTLTASSYDLTDTAGNISANLAGAATLTKDGEGDATLSGTNSYTGGTVIHDGALRITGDRSLGAVPGTVDADNIIFWGGDLVATSNATLHANRGIQSNFNVRFDVESSAHTLTVRGIIAGGLPLTKLGDGTLRLRGSNSYAGGTTVQGGILDIADDDNLGAVPGTYDSVNVQLNGGDLHFSDSFTLHSNRGLNLSGSTSTISVADGETVNYAGVVRGGDLEFAGPGTLILSGSSTLDSERDTTVSGGNLQLTDITWGTPLGNVYVRGGGLFETSSSASVSTTDTFIGDSSEIGTVDIAGGWDADDTIYVGSNGGGDLTIQSTGVVSSVSAYINHNLGTGSADISGRWNTGDLIIGHFGSGDVTIRSGGTLSSLGVDTVHIGLEESSSGSVNVLGTLEYSNIIEVGGEGEGTLTIGEGGTVNRILSTDPGLVTLAARVGDFYGEADTGTLRITGDTTPGILDGATVHGGDGNAILDFAHGGSNYHFTSDGTSSGDANFIQGSTTVTHTGTGKTTLSGNNSYTGGTTLSDGTLVLGHANAIGTTGTISFEGGTLQFSADNTTDYSGRFSTADNQAYAIDTGGQAITLASDLTSSGGSLTKSGNGALTLSGNNTYTGTTIVTESTLRISSDDNLGSGQLILNGGNLLIEGGSPVTLDPTRGITTNAAGSKIFVNAGSHTTFAGVIDGTGDLVKDNSGNLILTGANTYTGVTNIRNGRLVIDGDTSLGAAPGSAAAEHLRINGGSLGTTTSFALDANRGISLSARGGNIRPDAGTTLTYNGIIADDGADTGSLSLSTDGTLALGGTNTYTGGTTVSAGTLSITGGGSISHAGADLDVGASNGDSGNLVIANLGSANSANGNLGRDAGSTGTAEIAGTWTNANALAIGSSGAGTLTLQNNGTLRVNSGAGTVTLAANSGSTGTLNVSGGVLNAATVHGGNGTAVLDFDHSNSNYHFTRTGGSGGDAVDITGATTVRHTGGGTTTLTGNNSFTGKLQIHAGTVVVASDASLGFNDVSTGGIQLHGGTLRITDDITSARDIDFAGDSMISVDNGKTFSLSRVHPGININITGDSQFTKNGNGTMVLNDSNNHTGGTVVADGTLVLNDTGADNSALQSAVTVNFGATLRSDENNQINDAVSIHMNGGLWNLNNASESIGNGGLAFTGGTISATGSGSFDLASDITVNASARTATVSAPVTITDAIVNLTVADGSADSDLIISGAISGDASRNLVKRGAGILTLSGTNNFAGTTRIIDGTLHLTGSSANSAFQVESGATLSGSGTLGALTLKDGSILAPGNSPGTLNVGDTVWEGGATLEWEINNAAGIVSTNWDLLNITGGLTITATEANPFSINLVSLTTGNAAGDVVNFDSDSDYVYSIAATTTGITGFSADAFTLVTSGFSNSFSGDWSLALDGNNLNLVYTSAVPEPGSFALITALLGLGFATTRRRPRSP